MVDARHLATHPDENLLTAFAERSLTEKEQQSMLEHLSACARCRDVVFLAQQAFLETETQAEGAPLPAPVARGWVRWGSLGVAGVLAVLLIAVPIAVYRHRGHAVPGRVQEIVSEGRLGVPATTEARPSADSLSVMRTVPPQLAARPEAKRASSAAVKSHAEGSAEIAGSVADRSGAAVPGAHVTVRAAVTGNAKSAVTNAQGQFDVASLPSGDYQVEVQAPGFQMYTQPVTVQPSERASLDAKLDVGAASQTVTVSAANGAVDAGIIGGVAAGSGAAGGTIAEREVSRMPLAGRNSVPATPMPPSPAKPATASASPAAPAIGGPVASGMVVNGDAPVATFAVKDGVVQRCMGTDCVAQTLPSGAQAISVATSGRTVMALDADGNVFLSSGQDPKDDQGEHWKLTTVQWLGKAVGLRVEPPMPSGLFMVQPRGAFSAGATHGVVAAKSAPAPVPPKVIFELTNDKGQIWVSADEGKTWTAK